MKSKSEISGAEIVLKLLEVVWTPAMEARRTQDEFDVHSLEGTSRAAGRAGYEVCYADLPAKVSGFAMYIAGKPHIVVNRAKSREHQQYTFHHELGHHILHLIV
jgi:Zn-dependent peptidase ImmA (M78 family)